MLTIDIGNSRIKWGVWHDAKLTEKGGIEYSRHDPQAALEASLGALQPQPVVWVACVAGQSVEQALTEWLKSHWSVAPVMLRSQAELGGMSHAYDDPSQHGVDRWAALLGAKMRYETAVCVISAGTAVTVDLMDASGQHRGGRIMPGLNMMRAALLENTAGINAIDGEVVDFANNTADAVSSGTLHMLCAAIDEVCAQAQVTLGETITIIMTGGMATAIVPHLKTRAIIHEPHLVLHGLFAASEL